MLVDLFLSDISHDKPCDANKQGNKEYIEKLHPSAKVNYLGFEVSSDVFQFFAYSSFRGVTLLNFLLLLFACNRFALA